MERTSVLFDQPMDDRLGELVQGFLSYCAGFRRYSEATVKGYRSDLYAFLRFVRGRGATNPEQVSRDVIMLWASGDGTCAPATIRRRIASVGSFWKYLCLTGIAETSPVRGIPRPRVEPQVPRLATREDTQAMIAEARHSWEFAAVVLLATTGVRRMELAKIEVGDVDLEEGTLLVRGKGAKERKVALPTMAVDAIKLYLPSRRPRRETSRLLVTHVGCVLGRNTIWTLIKRLAKRAGLQPSLSPHWLRHGYATGLLRAGADIRDVQAALGHSDLASTSRYLWASPDRQRAAVEALAAGLRG